MFRKRLVWLLAVPGLLWANATTATISGTVSDQAGAPLSRVEIVLTCIDNGKVWSVHTDKRGKFTASNLPLGEYVLGAFSTGFITATGGVTLEDGKKEVVDFTLKSEVSAESDAGTQTQMSPPPIEPSPPEPLASVSPRTAGFAVQIAAYQTRDKAEALLEMLEDEGYPAYILEVEVPELGRHYRVRVGPFKSEGRTKEVASEVRRRFPQEGPDLWIVPPH
jgi:hypothetical protein